MKGILFKPWKIQAIAENPDREWQTRRVIKPQPMGADYWTYYQMMPSVQGAFFPNTKEAIPKLLRPRYQSGETVYIKEAHCLHCFKTVDGVEDACYKTDDDTGEPVDINCEFVQWRSPLFMPVWAARYFIKITSVTPQRLQLPLSKEDLDAEGGEAALLMLEKLDGQWIWKYEFVRN